MALVCSDFLKGSTEITTKSTHNKSLCLVGKSNYKFRIILTIACFQSKG